MRNGSVIYARFLRAISFREGFAESALILPLSEVVNSVLDPQIYTDDFSTDFNLRNLRMNSFFNLIVLSPSQYCRRRQYLVSQVELSQS